MIVEMTAAEVDQLVDRACRRKRPIAEPGEARREAYRASQVTGEKICHYRCPFSEDHHWHVGHPPSMEVIAQIAYAVRWLYQHPEST